MNSKTPHHSTPGEIVNIELAVIGVVVSAILIFIEKGPIFLLSALLAAFGGLIISYIIITNFGRTFAIRAVVSLLLAATGGLIMAGVNN